MTNPRCPGCSKTLRASARVVSDGNDYLFYLCPQCEDVVVQDPDDGSWHLRGERSSTVVDLVTTLQSIAVESWRKRSMTRKPLTSK